ncbi:MAG: type II toxin-antitoxin system VapC family toxin [Panacagrimonas sp.]
MAEAVLDASAVLCLLQDELGAKRVESHLVGAHISAVNLCEVLGKLADAGLDDIMARNAVADLGLEVHPFDHADADEAASLRIPTRTAGLSLGDRACLALARRLGSAAVTSDRAWSRLKLDVAVVVAR